MKEYLYSILNSAELFASANGIAEAAKQALSGDKFALQLVEKVTDGTSMLAKALGKSLINENTSLLLIKDGVRQRKFILLRDYIKAFAGEDDAAKSSASKELTAIIKRIGWSLYQFGYVKETTSLHSLFQEFDSAVNSAKLETLGATAYYHSLVEAQTDFETTAQLKAETGASIDLPLAKTAKIQITTYIQSLLSYISANTLLLPETYTPLSDKIDELIVQVVTTAHARQTREENEAKKEAESNATTKVS